jgi:hypothetical protein
MATTQKPFTTLQFTGRRFADHGLDLDVVPELTAYRRLVVETAKEIWRRKHPKRVRIPKGFEHSIVIKFYKLEAGSTAVPLFRSFDEKKVASLIPFNLPDEVDFAAELINSTIQAASENKLPPPLLTRTILPIFEEFGKSLKSNEAILLKNPDSKEVAKYTPSVREKILGWRNENYQDLVELSGEIRATDLDGSSFVMRLDNGDKIHGRFSPEQEPTVLDALRNHETSRIRIGGIGEFSEEGNLKQVVQVHDFGVADSGDRAPSALPTLLEAITAISKSVPSEAWKSVPTDLAQELDSYLYGPPKTRG